MQTIWYMQDLCRDGLAPRCERLSTSGKIAVCAENCKNTFGPKWVKFDTDDAMLKYRDPDVVVSCDGRHEANDENRHRRRKNWRS